MGNGEIGNGEVDRHPPPNIRHLATASASNSFQAALDYTAARYRTRRIMHLIFIYR